LTPPKAHPFQTRPVTSWKASDYVSRVHYDSCDRELTSGGDLLSSSSNTDNDALTPALVASLESRSHNVNVTGAVEGVVTATISHLNELLLDGLVLELHGVDEVGGTELLSPLLLAVVDIDDDDLGRTVLDATLNDRKTDTAGTEDSNVGALLDTTLAGSDDSGTVTSGDTTAEQASAVHGGLVGDLDDRNVGNDSVLGEGGGTHEVEEILALALEARGSVRHDTLALSCSDLATEVGLARLAELALLTFGGAEIKCQLLSLATHRFFQTY
jgi:hypothetical protein